MTVTALGEKWVCDWSTQARARGSEFLWGVIERWGRRGGGVWAGNRPWQPGLVGFSSRVWIGWCLSAGFVRGRTGLHPHLCPWLGSGRLSSVERR